jgi:hypothetical protein
MMSKVDAVISGLNEYVNTLKNESKDEVLFCLTKFNTQAEVVYAVEPLEKVAEFNSSHYTPNGMTALLDAVGFTIKAVDDVAEDGDDVLFAIMTDGEENSSREFNTNSVGDLIKSRTKDGWEFVFMGADQNAWTTAANWGISRGNTIQFTNDSVGVTNVMHNHAVSTANYVNKTAAEKLATAGNYFSGTPSTFQAGDTVVSHTHTHNIHGHVIKSKSDHKVDKSDDLSVTTNS